MTLPIPEFAIGPGQRFKLTAREVAGRHSNFTCPIGMALHARFKGNSLQPNDREHWKKNWDNASRLHFALNDGYAALIDGQPISRIVDGERNLTHAQRRFFRHALGQLEDLRDAAMADAGVEYELGAKVQRSTNIDGMQGELSAFGQHFRSPDGAVHEVVRLRLRELRAQPRPEDSDWNAIAAGTVLLMPNVPPEARIRIAEFSLANGEYRCVFDGFRSDVLALPGPREAIPEALSGRAFRPGKDCSSCGFLNVCPAVPQRRGVLGLPDRAVATRYLTSADLHAYDRCPTAFQAQRWDYLPDGYHDLSDFGGGSTARDRGTAVHQWLKWAHSRQPGQGCELSDLPEPSTDEAGVVAAAAGLTDEAYGLAFPFLRQHIDHCMRGLDGLGGWTLERRVVVFDADADIVVVSTPDSRCSVAETGEPIWREVKSTSVLPPDVSAALHLYPGFALNVALLVMEVGRPDGNGFAELEVLTPNSAEVFTVELHDGELVAEAQRVVAGIGHRFAQDLVFDRRPSGACAYCSVHRWCDPPQGVGTVAAAPVVDDAEFQDEPDPF